MIEETSRSSDLPRRQRWLGHPAMPWVACVLVLVAAQIDRTRQQEPAAVYQAYHARVRMAASQVPIHFGDWLGVDVPVPQGAVTLLKPNAIISRRYENLRTDRRVTLLIVHCQDARDLLGHYPPVCYTGQGWNQRSATPRDWQIGTRPIHGTQYRFEADEIGDNARQIVVDNFMLLPNGQTGRDMDAVGAAAAHLRRKLYGAAQVQLVYDAGMSDTERVQIFEQIVPEAWPLISAILQHDGERAR